MNNEPVAWMALNELNGSYSTFTNDQKQRLLPHVSQCYGKWIPLYTHLVKEQELLDEVTKLRWEINHREQDIDALKTKLNDVKYKYDIKTHQHIYTQVYVDELQAEIETLKAHPVKELTNIVVASATCSCGKVMKVTNLQPVKELTDDEIHDLMDEIRNAVGDDIERAMYRMAKAILRKAQEK